MELSIHNAIQAHVPTVINPILHSLCALHMHT